MLSRFKRWWAAWQSPYPLIDKFNAQQVFIPILEDAVVTLKKGQGIFLCQQASRARAAEFITPHEEEAFKKWMMLMLSQGKTGKCLCLEEWMHQNNKVNVLQFSIQHRINWANYLIKELSCLT